MRSPRTLRWSSIALALLGVVHLIPSFWVWKANWSSLPLEAGLGALFGYVATGLWILGSGVLLGLFSESAQTEARWPGPLARGVATLLIAGGILAMGLMWSQPESWILLVLSILSRWAANPLRKSGSDLDDEGMLNIH